MSDIMKMVTSDHQGFGHCDFQNIGNCNMMKVGTSTSLVVSDIPMFWKWDKNRKLASYNHGFANFVGSKNPYIYEIGESPSIYNASKCSLHYIWISKWVLPNLGRLYNPQSTSQASLALLGPALLVLPLCGL